MHFGNIILLLFLRWLNGSQSGAHKLNVLETIYSLVETKNIIWTFSSCDVRNLFSLAIWGHFWEIKSIIWKFSSYLIFPVLSLWNSKDNWPEYLVIVSNLGSMISSYFWSAQIQGQALSFLGSKFRKLFLIHFDVKVPTSA